MPALSDRNEIERFFHGRIRWDWRDDIEVIEVTERRRMLFRKETRVKIACSSYIACEQARISLAAFVANEPSEWKVDHWQVVEGADHPLRLELIEPKPEGY